MNLSIAIPNSALADELTQLDKSRKISSIARTCAIFKVNTIYIYQEQEMKYDTSLLITILKYLETPQFLRKRLFPKMNILKYAGVLHPLKIPSHVATSDPKKIKEEDIREGLVISFKGKKFADIGTHQPIPYYGKEKEGKRITLKFKKGYPELASKEISKEEVTQYWGYRVKERLNLFAFLSSWDGNIILTSRKGKIITNSQAQAYSKSKKPNLVVFGTTTKGLPELLENKINRIQNSKIYNFFPDQGTETVRLEEALHGTLSILNAA